MSIVFLVVGILLGILVGWLVTKSHMKKEMGIKVRRKEALSNKHLTLFALTCEWLYIRQKGKSLIAFFEDNEFKTIAVYGMSYLGERLVDELEGSSVEIKYAIDKNKKKKSEGLETICIQENMPEVDAIIVTAVTYFEAIEEELLKVTDVPIISLEDVINDVK